MKLIIFNYKKSHRVRIVEQVRETNKSHPLFKYAVLFCFHGKFRFEHILEWCYTEYPQLRRSETTGKLRLWDSSFESNLANTSG